MTPVATAARLQESYGRLPLSFEANQGQSEEQVRFLSRGPGYSLFLTANDAVLALRHLDEGSSGGARGKREARRAGVADSELRPPNSLPTTVVRIHLLGANATPQVTGAEELPGQVNYFRGNDSSQWHTHVATYGQVKYAGVYPGVDLVYYGTQRQLEYDFIVAPRTDPSLIRLTFLDQTGQHLSQALDTEGNVVVQTPSGALRLHKPRVYQDDRGVRREVAGSYVLLAAEASAPVIGFVVAGYDRSQPLVIDPVLSYSTYLGGNGYDQGQGIAVDAAGNAYVTGVTASSDFPTMNAFQPTLHNVEQGDAFITKFNAAGTALVYSTYLGGNNRDEGQGIAVDAAGNAYVTGVTASSDFPTMNAFQPTFGGFLDAFLTKLTPEGFPIYSTYLGGDTDDEGLSIAVDAASNTYVTGITASSNFPTLHAFQATSGGNYDAFITKFDATGTALVYSTYLGGLSLDEGQGIAVDAAGNAYVTGGTDSSNFPTMNSFQPLYGGAEDAFLTKLTAAGALVYSTYLGSFNTDIGQGIAVDAAGNAYVTGLTRSSNFPTLHAFQATGGISSIDSDAFITKFNATGTALVYSTYLGGSGDDQGLGIAVDAAGNAYVTGSTGSSNFPTLNAFQATCAGGDCAFITKLNAAGTALVYSTYLGSGGNQGLGIAVDAAGNAYVTGVTEQSNFPTLNAFQATFAGASSGTSADAFLTKLTAGENLRVTISATPSPVAVGATLTYTLTVTNLGPDPEPAATLADTLPAGLAFVSATPSQGSCGGAPALTCNLGALASGATATVTVAVTPTLAGLRTNTVRVRGTQVDPDLTNNTATTSTTVGFRLGVGISGNGRVSSAAGISCPSVCSKVYTVGTQVSLSATPTAFQTFLGWGGACSGKLSTCTVTMNANLTVTATFGGTVGTFQLTPTEAVVTAPEPFILALTWTVPTGGWRTLKDLELRLRDEEERILWVRFEEASNTLSVFQQAQHQFGPGAPPGSAVVLKTPDARLLVADSRVLATGPTDPSVTLQLAISLQQELAGERLMMEVAASDDAGHSQGFAPAGVLQVRAAGPQHQRLEPPRLSHRSHRY
jgi:uncharacterized repeat protein (TIGR01451 family)